MYEFAKTWNPIGGRCIHFCEYCYVPRLMKQFPALKKKYSGKPRIYDLHKNLGSGNFWFVQSMGDLFAENIPREIYMRVFEYIDRFPNNTYFFQSKNTIRFFGFRKFYPENTILCTTFETNRIELLKKYSGGIKDLSRIYNLYYIDFPLHITLEPLMDFDMNKILEPIKYVNPIQVNIGANTSHKIKLPEPPKEKILELISELEKFTKVHLKKNLDRLIK